MPRLVAALAVIAVIFVALLVLLAGRAGERPVTHVERAVSLANLS